jgi:hypothetical protein
MQVSRPVAAPLEAQVQSENTEEKSHIFSVPSIEVVELGDEGASLVSPAPRVIAAMQTCCGLLKLFLLMYILKHFLQIADRIYKRPGSCSSVGGRNHRMLQVTLLPRGD